jgi:hypothetical protein
MSPSVAAILFLAFFAAVLFVVSRLDKRPH